MPPPCVPDPLDHQNTNFNSSAPKDRKNAHLENYTEKTELDLPSFHHFSNNIWRHADLVVRDKNDQPVYLHRCILASKTNRFAQLTDDRVLTDTEFELIDAIYDRSLPPPNFSLYSRLESRFARLNLLTTNQFSDLTLIADDGEVQAHRILLASGSELMRAMLIGSWRESSSPTIRMTELTRDQLRECVRWIYARVMPDWSTPTKKLIQLLPAASRLCLGAFLRRLEIQIIERLKTSPLHIGLRFAILALDIAEQHNAKRLCAWITRHLSVHYSEISSIHKSQFLEINPAKRELIEKERWPPTWYIREKERYERTIKQLKDVKRP